MVLCRNKTRRRWTEAQENTTVTKFSKNLNSSVGDDKLLTFIGRSSYAKKTFQILFGFSVLLLNSREASPLSLEYFEGVHGGLVVL